MAKSKEQEFIQYKIALAFHHLLLENKSRALINKGEGKEDLLLAESIGDLSSSSGLRKATISFVLSGLSDVKVTTVDAMLEALGKSYTDFAKFLDSFSKNEILDYKKKKEKERADRARKKSKKK